MKKSLIISLIFCLLFTVVLVSCPNETKIPVEDVKIQDSVKNSLIEIKNMYNTVPSESQSDNVNPPNNFYIEVGTIDNVENIKVGETSFTPTDKLKLSIGNNSFITQSVYKSEDGKLKIAAPVLQMELSSEHPDIRVDDKKVFRTDYVSGLSEMKPEGVYWHNNTTLGVPTLSADKNSVTITIPASGAQKVGQTMLGIDFKYDNGSAPQTPSFYFTKKTVNTVDGVKTYTYGTTGTDPINNGSTTKQMLAIYPYGWNENDTNFNDGLSESAKYSKTIDYRVIGFVEEGDGIKAVASGKLLINLSKQVVPIEDISIENNVKSSLIEIKNMYNTVPSESQSDDVNPPTNFYIEVGEIDSVENIKVGETLFTPTDKLKLSIGNNSFITQSVYKIDDGKLKIAAPVLQMELSSEHPDIRVDNKKAFRTDYVSGLSEMKPEGVYWHNNATLGTPQLSADKKNVTITIPSGAQEIGKTYLGIDFKYNDGSAPQTSSFYFTKKTVNTVDGVKTYTYGTTGLDSINNNGTTKKMLALYPYGWSTDTNFNTGLSEAAMYSKTIDYRVIGFVEEGDAIKAVASGRLLINLSKPQ